MSYEDGPSRLSYGQIKQAAQDFLEEIDCNDVIPVPVEMIAEYKLKLNIVPINRLKQDFEIDGFISADFKNLYIDQDSYEKYPTRYNFTIAHEIGHYVLHKHIFESFKFDSTEEWKSFILNMNDEHRGWFEYQGFSFAGCLLMPSAPLKIAFNNALNSSITNISKAKEARIPRATYLEYALEEIALQIAPQFEVSLGTALKRIKNDNLSDLIP